MGTRIAVLDGGLHQRKAFASFHGDVEFLPLGKAFSTALGIYDVIIVTFHTDQSALARLKTRLERFATSGGVLVILGATEDSGYQWIPFCQWRAPFPKQLKIVDTNSADAKILFRDINSPTALSFNGKNILAHGTLLRPNDAGVSVLAASQTGDPIMLIVRSGLNGSALCTTLDPDYHLVSEVPGPQGDSADKARQSAGTLLRNIIDWAKSEASSKNGLMHSIQKLASACFMLLSALCFWSLLLVPGFLITYVNQATSAPQGTPFNILSFVIAGMGFVGSIVSIWQVYNERRMKTH